MSWRYFTCHLPRHIYFHKDPCCTDFTFFIEIKGNCNTKAVTLFQQMVAVCSHSVGGHVKCVALNTELQYAALNMSNSFFLCKAEKQALLPQFVSNEDWNLISSSILNVFSYCRRNRPRWTLGCNKATEADDYAAFIMQFNQVSYIQVNTELCNLSKISFIRLKFRWMHPKGEW